MINKERYREIEANRLNSRKGRESAINCVIDKMDDPNEKIAFLVGIIAALEARVSYPQEQK